MDNVTIEALAFRVGSLECACRRWRRAALAAILGGAVALMVGGAPKADGPKTVEAERFLLKDKDGRTRGEWGFTEEGWPIFRLDGRDGKRRISLFVSELVRGAAPVIFLHHGGDGKGHLTMVVRSDGEPRLFFTDKDGKPLITLPQDIPDPHAPPPPPPVRVDR